MKILIFLIIGITTFLRAQSQFEEFINRVNSISDPAEKAAVIDSFMTVAREQGIPFIEDNTANFIYLGNVNNVTVPGDFNGWDLDAASMFNLTQTNFWYYSQDFELNARLDYKFVLNGNVWILDPENPNTIMGGFGPNSELAMPEFVQPWEIEFNPDIEHGTIEDKSIFSTRLAGTYQLKIYLPPGYNENANYPAVYLQDGFEYVSLASAVNVLDNLLDSNKIKPIIGVFVKPNNRNSEYAFDKRNQYRLFFVEELVPFIDSIYNTIPEPGNRLVMGLSFGGNISALIAYNHPEVFGLCGLQSAAFWPNNFEAFNLIVNGPIKNIKWSSVWGSYEGLYSNMRNFRDFLIANNYELDWLELPEGHSWGLWRATIDNILTYFFPASPTGVEENNELIPEQFVLYQNYPNPFNPTTKIKFTISTSPLNPSPYQGEGHRERSITLRVYDVLGNEVAILVDEEKSAGNYEAEFNAASLPSGIYFYKLTVGNPSASPVQSFTDTKKMILLK